MKKIILIITVMFLLISVGVYAIDPAGIVIYETKNGNVTFDHTWHMKKVQGNCKVCHKDSKPEKILVDKKYGHGDCKLCHILISGPTECKECHKK